MCFLLPSTPERIWILFQAAMSCVISGRGRGRTGLGGQLGVALLAHTILASSAEQLEYIVQEAS